MNAPSTTDWQTWAALAIVVGTVVIFTVAIMRRRKNSRAGCGTGCDCPKPKVASEQSPEAKS